MIIFLKPAGDASAALTVPYRDHVLLAHRGIQLGSLITVRRVSADLPVASVSVPLVMCGISHRRSMGVLCVDVYLVRAL